MATLNWSDRITLARADSIMAVGHIQTVRSEAVTSSYLRPTERGKVVAACDRLLTALADLNDGHDMAEYVAEAIDDLDAIIWPDEIEPIAAELYGDFRCDEMAEWAHL